MSVNKATLLGHVGKDPECKVFDNGNKVANFSVATTEKYTNKSGEKVENTEWHNIAVFGKLADVVEKYVKKGQHIYIEGKIKTRSWEKDGSKHYTTEIVLNGFDAVLQMVGGKNESAQSAPAQTETQNAPTEQFEPQPDAIPF